MIDIRVTIPCAPVAWQRDAMSLGHKVRLVPWCLDAQVYDLEALHRVCEATADALAGPERQAPATLIEQICERVAMRAEVE